MSGDVEIVRYRAEHEPEVARLQTALWGPDPAENARYLEWKYARNPWAVDPPRIYLAVRGGEVVGMRGFFESRWELGAPECTVSIPLADDLAILEGERNTGLASRILRSGLAELAESGCEYVASLSPGMVTTLSSLALGWKSAFQYGLLARSNGSAPRWAWLRERVSALPQLWRMAGSPLLLSRSERAPFARLDAWRGRTGVQVARQPRCEEMARLVAELGRDGRIRHDRSAAYLAWRFANPMYEYRFLHAEGPSGLEGYLVLSTRVMGSVSRGRVYIGDLEGRSEGVRAALLGQAIEAGGFAELAVWAATLPPDEHAALTARGFAPPDSRAAARGHPAALVRATRDREASQWSLGGRALLDPASWDLRMLDSMAA